MTSHLDRARQLLADPRPPDRLATPGQATEVLAVLRGLVLSVDELTAEANLHARLLDENIRLLRARQHAAADQQRELDSLAEACANVLQLHQRSDFDGTCSSCRIPHPCHTSLAVTTRERA